MLIDCPPSLGVLTVNGLTAADEVLVPLQCEALSHRGVAQLLETITDVREFTNPRLQVRGVIATMFDPRGRHAREVLDDVQTRFGLTVLEPPIPKTVRFAEAPGPRRVDPRTRAAAPPARRRTARSRQSLHDDLGTVGRMSGFLREVGHRPERPARDPLGKAALFSDARRPGTLVVECSGCGESTRVLVRRLRARATCRSRCGCRRFRASPFNRRMTCPRAASGRGSARTG